MKVNCTVKSAKSGVKAGSLSWRLSHSGHVVSHGKTEGSRLQLDVNHLREGRYLLHVQGQERSTVIVIG